jgi:nitrate/nitrite transport system substrate-binding protein
MADSPETSETLIDGLVERSVEQAVFGGRRDFLKAVGTGAAAAMLADVFPMGAAKALAQAKLGPPEKKDLKIGFIPITCATPIIMA